jgi:hypothetical protein
LILFCFLGERSLHTGEVAGSIPAAPTIIPIQLGNAAIPELHHLRLAHHRVQEIWLSRSRIPHDVTREHLLQTIRFCEKSREQKN